MQGVGTYSKYGPPVSGAPFPSTNGEDETATSEFGDCTLPWPVYDTETLNWNEVWGGIPAKVNVGDVNALKPLHCEIIVEEVNAVVLPQFPALEL